MIYANDGPTTTLAAFSQFLLAKEAQKQNIRIILSSLGADEFMNGYVRHALVYAPEINNTYSLFSGYKPLLAHAKKINNKNLSSLYAHLLNRNNKKNIELDILVRQIFNKNHLLSAISICDSLLTLPPLLNMDDYLNMRFGIESRSPFLDYRFIEFCLSLQDDKKICIDLKTNEIYTKYLLREAFKDQLPKEIILRKDKIGFSSNINNLLRSKRRKVFYSALKLLRQELPNIKYFSEEQNLFGKFSR